MAKTAENIARAAQRRAAVTAYLNQNPQLWATAADLGTALDLTPKEAAYTGQNLAEQGLCRRALNVDGRSIYASLNANPDSLPEGATPSKGGKLVSLVPTKRAKKAAMLPAVVTPLQPRTMRANADEEVELMVSGKLIVIGRNPGNGRIRITLE